MKILIDGQTLETDDFYRGIGTYMRNVLPRLLKFSLSHQFYIILSDEKNLDRLDAWTRNRLHVILSGAVSPSLDYSRAREYTQALQDAVDKYHIDAVWDPNPLMVNVLFPDRPLSCKIFVMIHDIIPYLMPDKTWAPAVTQEYHRRLKMIKEDPSVCLLFNSEWSRKDWTEHLEDTASLMQTTPLSADARRFYCPRKKIPASTHPYILFTGGFAERKNIDGAIEAFHRSRLLHANDKEYLSWRLVIVGSCTRETREKYDQILISKGLTNQVEFTGFVSDDQLVSIYRDADLFFFPSKYEGFGLPLLEAMLSGAYIISADNSSLPEVAGPFAAYFSVDDPEQMAEALYEGYRRHLAESSEDVRRRQDYALSFSWDNTALRTLEFMEQVVSPLPAAAVKPTLAVFTPWPDQKTGIAHFEFMIIPYLARHFRVTVFTPAPAAERKPLEDKEVEIADLSSWRARRSGFDYKLFEIGNNALYHKEIMDLFLREGGIAEVHDFVLSTFFWLGYFQAGDKRTFRKLLTSAYGRKTGRKLYFDAVKSQFLPDHLDYPMSEAVVNLSDRTIFHNQWSADRMQPGKVTVIPLPSFPFAPAETAGEVSGPIATVRAWRQQGFVIIGCFGFVNENKHPEVSIRALCRLRKQGLPVRLVFWGDSNIESLPETIAESGVTEEVLVAGYLDETRYAQAFAETDIVVNLRHPSMGESSGPLCEAFQLGKAVIVSDLNQYREFPDDVCWKLPVEEKESEILAAYLRYLIEHPEVRQTLGKNAKAFAEYVLSPDRIARRYYEFITQDR